MDSSTLNFLAFGAVLIGGIGGILGGVSIVLHAIAPRTKTVVDDELAAGVDAAHDKLDEALGLLRMVVPASSAPSSTTSTVASPARNPQSGRVTLGVLLAAALPVLIAVGIGMCIGACSTIGTDVKAFENGAVACAKADSAQAKALGLQLGVDALGGFLAGEDEATIWNKVTADAEAAAKTQGIAVGACAFDGVLADVEKILHPPGTETSTLAARAAVDPLAGGRAALAAFERAHGVTSVVR